MQESHKPVLNTRKTKMSRAQTNLGPDSHNLKFDHFALQGNYGHGAGWEDVTAEKSLDQILARESEYKTDEPGTPYRLISVWVYTSTGKEKRFLVKRESGYSLFV